MQRINRMNNGQTATTTTNEKTTSTNANTTRTAAYKRTHCRLECFAMLNNNADIKILHHHLVRKHYCEWVNGLNQLLMIKNLHNNGQMMLLMLVCYL